MKTRFFCFPDMQTSFALAQEAGLTSINEHGESSLKAYTNDYALDVIGTLYLPTGNMIEGEDGMFFPGTAAATGWRVNARILSGDPLPESFVQYEVFPATPQRDFA